MNFLNRISLALLLIIYSINTQGQSNARPAKKGKLISQTFTSNILKENKIGLDLNRTIKIYLPADYDVSKKSYPVVYFLNNNFTGSDGILGGDVVETLIDRGVASGVVRDFIFVVPDYHTATTGSMFENSPVSGKWLDYTVQEVIPYVDKNFRTIARKESRALVGEFFGGRGAFKLAMTYPELFSVVYALHPVATGMGDLPWKNLPVEWNKLNALKSYPDMDLNGVSQIFVTVCQAFLPNPDRPPLYCDFFMELVNGRATPIPENMKKAKAGFHIDEALNDSGENLKQMKAIAFDWARFDGNHAHVDANRELSRKLVDLGIEHEAEEYNGAAFEKTWLDDGRFYTRVLPFLQKHLVFEVTNPSK